MRNRFIRADKRLRSAIPQAHDNFRADNVKLAHKERRACFNLIFFRQTIFRRPALDHIGDVHILPRQAHGFDHLRQQLARAAHKWQPLHVFIAPRAFAHEHQVGARVAVAKNNFVPALAEFTALAIPDVRTDVFQRIAFHSSGGVEERGHGNNRRGDRRANNRR